MGAQASRVTVDSGRYTGWAMSIGVSLVSCGLAYLNDSNPLSLPPVVGALVWVEKPKWYPPPNEKGKPNDLITLGTRAGRAQERYLSLGCKVTMVFPDEWKGQEPKDVNHRRTLKKLTPSEASIVASLCAGLSDKRREDVMDAIGILIWSLEKDGHR